MAAKYAKQWGCTVLLKSYRSVIACHDGRIALNTNGNSGLAKGGSGDVLSGITLAMLSQRAGYVRRGVCGGVYAGGKRGRGDGAAEGTHAYGAGRDGRG